MTSNFFSTIAKLHKAFSNCKLDKLNDLVSLNLMKFKYLFSGAHYNK